MKKTTFFIVLLIAFVVASCIPAATIIPTEAVLPTATLTLSPVATTTATITPTLPPQISLPVDRFTTPPDILPLTIEYISKMVPVATYSEAQLIEVNVPEVQDRALVVYNNGVQVYDLPSLTPRPFLPVDLTGLGNGLTYRLSPTGKYLAVITRELSNQVQIWDLDTLEKTCSINFPGEIDNGGRGARTMEFFPETNRFLFNGIWVNKDTSKREIRLLDLDKCQEMFVTQPDYWYIFSVSPDGRNVAYLENAQVILQKVEDNSKFAIGDNSNVRGVGFTTDSQSVIISYTYTTKIYNLASREIVNQLESNQGKNTVYIYALNNGKRILIAGESDNRIWDTETKTSFSLGAEFITAYREFFDDRNGALVTWQSVWNLEHKNRVNLKDYPNGRSLSALSQDANFLVVSSGYAPYQTNLLDATTGKIITSLPGEYAPVAVDGETFITSGDGRISAHNFSNGDLLNTLQGEYMNGVTLKEQQVLIWDAKGSISILDVGKGRILQQAALPKFPMDYGRVPDHYFSQHNFLVWEKALGFDPSPWLASNGRNTLAVSPDHKTGIEQSGDVVHIFSITGDTFIPTQENLLASYTFKGFWLQFKFSADSKQVVGITYSQMIVWDSQTGKLVRAFSGKDYLKGNPTDFGFSPDGSQVIISSIQDDTRSLAILNVKTGALVQSYEVPNCNLSIPYAFTADGSQIFTITQDCRIGLFNISDWKQVKSFGGPYSGAKFSLALSPDGKLLAAGYKQSLEVWDVGSGKLVKSFNDLDTHIVNFIGDFAISFSPDGKLLAVRYGRWFVIGSTVELFGVPVAP